MHSTRRIFQLSAIFYFIVQSYSLRSLEFTGLKLKIKYLFICPFHFLLDPYQWGSGSATLLISKCLIIFLNVAMLLMVCT